MAQVQLPVMLAMVSRVLADRVYTRMGERGYSGLRPAYGYAFHFLAYYPSMTAVALGLNLGVTKQAAVQLAEELEGQGFVIRRPHPSDGRAKIIELTERGWTCLHEIEELWSEEEERWESLVGGQLMLDTYRSLAAYVDDAAHPPGVRPIW